MKDSYTEKLRTLRQRKLATKSQKIKYNFAGVGGKLNSSELKRDLHKGFFMLDLNEQTNKYYNFLTDSHIAKSQNFMFFRIWLPLLESKESQIVKIKK